MLAKIVPAALIFFLALPAAAFAAGTKAALAKLKPWVVEQTRAGASAEFLIVLSRQADLSGADEFPTKEEKGWFVYETLLDTARSTQGPLLDYLSQNGIPHRSHYIVNLIWAKGSRQTALDLAAFGEVGRIEGNPRIMNDLPAPVPAPARAASSGIEPNIGYVQADQVWAMGHTGEGIVVGNQDSGFEWDHPALKEKYRGWTGETAVHDYNWHDSVHETGSSCGADSPVPCDDHGHGTHTLGTIIGDDGAGNQIGMAPGAKWIGCRNMNDGAGTPETYLECFEFFLAPYPVGGTPEEGNPDLAPDVTNNSWGCPGFEGCEADTLLLAIQAHRAAGIMTVAAAGNEGPGCSSVSSPPAIHGEVYSVAALHTGTDEIASYSSRGPVTADGSGRRKPDISAPGHLVRSSFLEHTYLSIMGTSMASPHVAGAVALLWSARPELKNQVAATEAVLNSSAAPIHSNDCDSDRWPNNTFGCGRLDVKAAVDYQSRRWVRDFGGDGASDAALFRPADGSWLVRALTLVSLGTDGDRPVPGDYNGDRIAECAVFRPPSGRWSVRGVTSFGFGTGDAVVFSGDGNGDGTAEAGIFQPASGLWAVRDITRLCLGGSGDSPVPGYYAAGAMDVAIFRSSSGLWQIGRLSRFYFGSSGDSAVPGDYDGDGLWEAAVFRGSSGIWAVRGVTRFWFGADGDAPLPGDYDRLSADGGAVFRASSGFWAIRNLTRFSFGSSGDVPVTR
jgi:subtilisin family serine protease